MYQSQWAPRSSSRTEKDTSDAANELTTAMALPSANPPVTSAVPASSDLTTNVPPIATYDYSQPEPGCSADDAFAQTGAQQDDLFDDVNPEEEESMRLRSDDDLFNDDFTPAPEPEQEPVPVVVTEQPIQPPTQPARARGDGYRIRGRGRGGRGGRGDTRNHTRDPITVPSSDGAPSASTAPENAPPGPRKDTVPSVRGDRQATGGIRKPKMTEEQLAEKMAEISIKNASLTAAHARAEADAASFAERENVAKKAAEQRRKEERRDRQHMMGERERNRQRKLKAAEGREWDAGKQEEDYGKGGRFDKRGGFAGDQGDYTDGREYLYREKRGGDRGGSSRRGEREVRPGAQEAPKQDEFPTLPPKADNAPTESNGSSKKSPTESTSPNKSLVDGGKSWADQMESNPPA